MRSGPRSRLSWGKVPWPFCKLRAEYTKPIPSQKAASAQQAVGRSSTRSPVDRRRPPGEDACPVRGALPAAGGSIWSAPHLVTFILTISLLISHGVTVKSMEKLLEGMRASPQSVKFSDAVKVATHYFGEHRTSGSHYVFRMPWPGDPRVNLQNCGGKAKAYQVRQLLAAVERKLLSETERRQGVRRKSLK
jgi:hypothetical protein